MNAVVYTEYGSPDVLKLTEVEKPTPKENEVLIKILASTVTSVDVTFRSGDSWSGRLYTGLLNPKRPTLGSTFAGEIEAVGKQRDVVQARGSGLRHDCRIRLACRLYLPPRGWSDGKQAGEHEL